MRKNRLSHCTNYNGAIVAKSDTEEINMSETGTALQVLRETFLIEGYHQNIYQQFHEQNAIEKLLMNNMKCTMVDQFFLNI